MDKRALQTFAIWAKDNLETQIKVSLNLMGIYGDKNIQKAYIKGDVTIIEGYEKSFSKTFKVKRDNIERLIKEEGYKNVIEQFAYTWFNRIVALRFMEVHGYLNHGFKIFPDGKRIEPEILLNLNFVKDDLNLDVEYYTKLKQEDNIEELYRYVLFQQCNSLSESLPMLFSNEYQYLELLLPPVLLTGETIITKIVEIGEEFFLNDIEVIGWLYQYYVSHLREDVRKRKKTTQEDIPILSQIFTPDWIVKYMSENSIGRIWLESYPNSSLKNEMKYYVEEAKQTLEVEAELKKTRYQNVNPKDIKVIEPCAGSGHILVYVFDLFYKMYEEMGYLKRDIPTLILKNNLVGLDIDKRASQLAQFSLMMKARSIDPRFFDEDRRIVPRVFEIKDSQKLYNLDYKNKLKDLIENDWKQSEYNLTENDLKLVDYVVKTFEYGKTIGSLLKIKPSKGYLFVRNKLEKLRKISIGGVFTHEFIMEGLKRLSDLLRLAHYMSLKYDVMITNPPYLGISKLEKEPKKYLEKRYPNSKNDFATMFMQTDFIKENGMLALVNPDSWMFLKSFENMRKDIINTTYIINMTHHGLGVFDAVVQTTSFVIRRKKIKNYKGRFYRLVNCRDKESAFLYEKDTYEFISNKTKFINIPGQIIGYWINESIEKIYKRSEPLINFAMPRQGMATGDNNKFVRMWWEPSIEDSYLNSNSRDESIRANKKWVPYNKGGAFRRWYGNNESVVYFKNFGESIASSSLSRFQNSTQYLLRSITWGKISTNLISFRYKPYGHVFDVAGTSIFTDDDDILIYLLGVCNSKVMQTILNIVAPTLNYEVGQISQLPIILPNNVDKINEIVKENINISKKDWDSFETSWNFTKHNLINSGKLKEIYIRWFASKKEQFEKLKNNEEELNEFFIDLYELQDELKKDVDDKYVSISLDDEKTNIVSLISYLIGVLMGRFSLIEEGLIFAGGKFDVTRYGKYELDDDGIIPLYSKLGMENGLTAKIITLIKQIYGEDNYRENIDFIAEGLGKKQNETSEETLNRYLNEDFYNDHLKTYQKRPIYWMFSSGKDNGFKALVYLHRYNEDTLAIINSKYLLPETTRLKNEINDLKTKIKSSDGATQRRYERERDLVLKQYREATEYALVVDHMANKYIKINLDDGVKKNYDKFQNIEIISDTGIKIKKNLLVKIK